MSDPSDTDNAFSLGRGRGRGQAKTDPETRTASSTSEKRKNDEGNGNGKPANGNGQKRGRARDNRDIPAVIKTKPQHITDKMGTSGTTKKYTANYFKLLRRTNFEFVQLRVDFEPEIDNVFMRKAFVGMSRELLGGYIFDGQNLIYITQQLPQDEYINTVTSREGVEYAVKFKKTGQTIEMTDGRATQIMNLILRRVMDGLKMQLVGRNLYDPQSKVRLQEYRIELWPGYITSIRQHEEDILVCCEVSHKVMRNETIYDILKRCRNESRNFQDDFKKEIIGSIVLTEYNKGGNSKTYRVDDVDFSASPSSTFDMKGVQKSYVDYYKDRYNLQITDRRQPMLVSRPSARDIRDGRTQDLYLVPELCRATGLTDKMRSNFQMMKAMATHTQMDPVSRRERLLQLTRRWHQTPECLQQLNAFNTEIDTQLVTINGRALNQEEMVFGNNATYLNDNRVDWTNPLKSNAMFQCVDLKRWVLIYPARCANDTQVFLRLLHEVAHGAHYAMSAPKEIELRDDRTATYSTEIEKIIGKDPKLIMIVVPNNAADRYSAIKKLTCVSHAIPTQVIVHKTMMPKKGNMAGVKSIATKVMIQINSKLGGAPWMVRFPLKGVMTIGFDVTHNTQDRSQSFGAFVASMDLKKDVRYYSAVSSHRDGNEVSQNIAMHMSNALKAYKRRYDVLPERIFFYRDGVGDGDLERVYTNEALSIDCRLKEIYEKLGIEKPPMFSFIIVNKRINTRIFQNKGATVENPVSGTVIDSVITLPERYDFFLVSQCVRQGTVTPTSYNVIFDSSQLPPDKMQMLTYKNTHLYYNWSGCTRVPAVVQYAHKLAFLVGQYLQQIPNQSFDDMLYFL